MIVNGLKRRGIEVRSRKPSSAEMAGMPVLPSSGKIIELIGTQGVGKSTLNRSVHGVLKDRWFFRADLDYTGPKSEEVGDIERMLRDIYFRRLEHLRTIQPDPWKSLTVARQMSNVICENLVVCSETFPRGLIVDEGLFKNFPREILDIDPDDAQTLWQNRSFIHLKAQDPQVAAKRYLGRAEDRRRAGFFQHSQALEDVVARIEADNLVYDRICQLASDRGCHVLEVFAEDSVDTSRQRIEEFERNVLA